MNTTPEIQATTVAEIPAEIEKLAYRQGRTKGQIAYLAAPRLSGAIEAARQRRIKILQSGGRLKRSDEASMETIVEKLRISRKLLSQAHEIHKHFDADKKLKEEWEPKILDPENPLGLGSVLRAISEHRPEVSKQNPERPSECVESVSVSTVAQKQTSHSLASPEDATSSRQSLTPENSSDSIDRLLLKRGLSKGQLVFLAFPHLEPELRAARERRLKVLRSGGRGHFPKVASPKELASRLGVSDTLMDQARQIHDEFRAPGGEDLRRVWEPRILDPRKPMGLNAVLDAIEEGRTQSAASQAHPVNATPNVTDCDPAPLPSDAKATVGFPAGDSDAGLNLPAAAPLPTEVGGSTGRARQQPLWPATFECVARGIVEEGGSIEAQVADSIRWGLEYAKSVPAFPVYSLVALVPVARLEIHPMAAQLPVMASPAAPKLPRRGTGRFAWEAPLVVTREFRIVDGRQRYWSALAGRQEAIPCTFIKEDHAAAAMLIGILGRHHLSRGQVAYLCALILEAEQRAIRSQSTGDRKSPHSGNWRGTSAGHLVRCLKSVIRTYFQNAEWLLSLFESEPGLRQKLESAILRDQKPLPLLEALRIARRHAEEASDSGPWWNGLSH